MSSSIDPSQASAKPGAAPAAATEAVLVRSVSMPDTAVTVEGPDFNKDLSLHELLEKYTRVGFQATSIGRAIKVINDMITWRLVDDPILPDESPEYTDPVTRANTKCKIFFGYTSNLVSSGLREVIRFLVQHSMVDVLVATAGGVEEDFIKCLGKTYLSSFEEKGSDLRKKGLNRIGNLVVPNDNYCVFEDWMMPILDKMLKEQKEQGIVWSPSKIIHRLGKEIDNPDSIYYWAYKNNIPVYCPALTDGSLGDMIYFHTYKNPGLVVDIVADIRSLNDHAFTAKKSGMIILGGGVIKHQICNANLMRNGADYAVYINTGQEFDGSDAGARPDEAISWGKIKMTAEPVKVYADATIVFPLIVAETFAKHFHEKKK
ncbi:2256_t:CDS:2, partial [Paraglomus brasilianum]